MSQSATRLAEFIKSHQSDKALVERLNVMFLSASKAIAGYEGNDPKQAFLNVIAKLSGEKLVRFFDTCWDKARGFLLDLETGRRTEAATLEAEKCRITWCGKIALVVEADDLDLVFGRTVESIEHILCSRVARAQNMKDKEAEETARQELRMFRSDLRRAQSLHLHDQREAERRQRPTVPSDQAIKESTAALFDALTASTESN